MKALFLMLIALPVFAQTQEECKATYKKAVSVRIIDGINRYKVMTGPMYDRISFNEKKGLARVIGCAIAGQGQYAPLVFLDYKTGKQIASVSSFGRFSMD